jgi:hypothetical protein
MTSSDTDRLKDGPATYQVRVRGVLDTSWSDNLNGMSIVTDYEGDNPPISILTGRLADQAALTGVLNSLHDLGFALLSVEILSVR